MTIYVDQGNDYFPGRYKGYCHMISDSSMEELIAFAIKIGMDPNRLQTPHKRPHFDLPPRVRAAAIKLGAIPLSRREMARLTLSLKGKSGRIK